MEPAARSCPPRTLACQLPAETGVPLSRWSCPDLAREVTDRGITETISASTIRRVLAADAIKPWQHRSWLFIRAPDFTARAARVLDLYAGVFDGAPLGDHLGQTARWSATGSLSCRVASF